MRRATLAFILALSPAAFAQPTQIPLARVADDAKAIDRVAEMSKRDLPVEILRRIINEDIELLRGGRGDGTYQYASYDRMESSRVSDSFSIQAQKEDQLVKAEVHAPLAYRALLELPTRRLLITKNRRLWIDHVEVEYMPQGSGLSKTQSTKVETWLEPGQSKSIDIPEIARQATVRVFTRAGKETGFGILAVTILQARIFDNLDSPYADAVESAKTIAKNLDHGEIPAIRSAAQRMAAALRPTGDTASMRSIDVIASPTSDSTHAAATPPDIYAEMQAIEDLLTGTDAERRQGLDRLHQLLRRTRR